MELNCGDEIHVKAIFERVFDISFKACRTIDIIEYNSDFKRKFNIRVESSESKRGIYCIVEDMIVSLLDRVDPLLHHIKYMKHDDSARSNCDEQEIDSTYRNLEKLLQKYEADIRKHIGVQHTMKIYSE